MKILVTGAAGFIGSHLTEALLVKGHEVVAIDALLPELYSVERKKTNWNNLGNLGLALTQIELDLRFPFDSKVIEDCEYIFHLAAMPGLTLSWENTQLYIDCNILATTNLLKACNLKKVRKFIHVSTSSVYGRRIDGDESSMLAPISPYGVTKLAAEQMVTAFSDASGVPFSIFRPFSVYGPQQRDDMAFNIFIRKMSENQEIQIYGDGSQSRTNTYIADLVTGLISGMGHEGNGEIYNLSGNEQYNVLEVIGILGKLLDKVPKLNFIGERLGDQQETKNISTKAYNQLGYCPKTKLSEGLLKQIQWQLGDIGSLKH